MNNELFIYIDEFGTPNIRAKENFGVGALIVDREITQIEIDNAWKNYIADPEKEEIDKKAISRSFFHASEDSKHAHSHLCSEIHKFKGCAEFNVDVVQKDKLSFEDEKFLKNPKRFHENLASTSLLHCLVRRWSSITIFIAAREKSFSKYQIHNWEKNFQNMILASSIRKTIPPIHLPEFKTYVVNGSNPGIQFCDFILWSANRKQDLPWIKRAGFSFTSKIQHKGFLREKYHFKNNFKLSKLIRLPNREMIENRTRDNQEIFRSMINIEMVLKSVVENNLLPKLSLVKENYKLIEKRLTVSEMSNEQIHAMAKIYLLICDQVPLYDPKDSKTIENAYLNKEICSMALNLKDTRWLPITQFWRIGRNNYFIKI